MAVTHQENLFETVLGTVVEASGFEIVDLEYSPNSKTLRLFIDHIPQWDEGALPPELATKESQVSLEDCVAVDRVVGDFLEEDDRFPDSMTLEVSSPGVNRSLKKDRDFMRFRGEKVSVKVKKPLSPEQCLTELDFGDRGRKQFKGVLLGLSEENSRILVGVQGMEISIPRNEVTKAQIEYDFSKVKFRHKNRSNV